MIHVSKRISVKTKSIAVYLCGVVLLAVIYHLAARLGYSLHADLFLISTEVEKVAVNFNKPNVQWLDSLTMADARSFLAEGQFGKGAAWSRRLSRC